MDMSIYGDSKLCRTFDKRIHDGYYLGLLFEQVARY